MVSVSSKPETAREAVAAGSIRMTPTAYELVKAGDISKGDVLSVARIAGIMAAKRVDELIPLTHPLLLNEVAVFFSFDDLHWTIGIEAKVCSFGKTGVEMEALTAVSVAALTIYDMCKSVDKGMVIGNIRLLLKTGGKSGRYTSTAG
ncbi:MAG: molybdenum cofactor biosynthesis protein C [Deltaproteobacteria bacterium RIFOXYD12_FULL_57_12]|nr:MAG: molybdenum cofactor biosynthesis protein C [Deltaproteobacteria bacterium RIFOXYD12_FULL_57_12]